MDRSRLLRKLIWSPFLGLGLGTFSSVALAQSPSDAELFDQHLLNKACAPYAAPWCPPSAVPQQPAAPLPEAPPVAPTEPAPAPEQPLPAPSMDQVFLPPAQGTLLAASSIAGVPSMIGDFFGTASGTIALPNLVGRSVHHTTSINDFHLITGTGPNATFVGGPGGGEYYVLPNPNGPFGPTAPGQVVEGLVYGPAFLLRNEVTGDFIAVRTDETVTIDPRNPANEGDALFGVPVYTIYDTENPFLIDVPSPGSGGVVVGRQKIADNGSPIPRDRVFLNYSYFDNVPLTAGGVNVNRFTPGVEKTFFDGNASFEARFPFATTLDTNILVDGLTNDDEVEFGNVVLYSKLLLFSSPTYALSTGLGVSLPTADDLTVGFANGPRLVEIDNKSVHLLPFVGGVWVPNSDFFVHGFVQVDVDMNGNPVLVNTFENGFRRAGRLDDVTLLYTDIGAGYWAYRANSPDAVLSGIIPTVELHYTRSLEGAETIQSGPFTIGDFSDDIQVLNATIGTTLLLGDSSTLQFAYGTPIGNSADHVFDGEFRATFNWYFGGPASQFAPFGAFTPNF